MEASIVDLRYKMKDVLQSLDRQESVKIYYHDKLKGIIQPCKTTSKKSENVDEIMDQLRGIGERLSHRRRAR